MDFLLNYVTLSVAIVAFAVVLALLLLRRKRLPPALRAFLWVLLGLLALYLVFVLWLTLGFGNRPAVDPSPIAAAMRSHRF